MPKLVSEPSIEYKCDCGAVSSADPCEFTRLNTNPPMYSANCAFCGSPVTCCPQPLIAKEVHKGHHTL